MLRRARRRCCWYFPDAPTIRLLGKWKIDQRTKETDVSYVDPLSSNIKKQTGNNTIELLKDSIVVSGGGKDVVENSIQYQIQELEGARRHRGQDLPSRARTTPTTTTSTSSGSVPTANRPIWKPPAKSWSSSASISE